MAKVGDSEANESVELIIRNRAMGKIGRAEEFHIGGTKEALGSISALSVGPIFPAQTDQNCEQNLGKVILDHFVDKKDFQEISIDSK